MHVNASASANVSVSDGARVSACECECECEYRCVREGRVRLSSNLSLNHILKKTQEFSQIYPLPIPTG